MDFTSQAGIEYDRTKWLLADTNMKEIGVYIDGVYKIVYFDFLELKSGKEVLLN